MRAAPKSEAERELRFGLTWRTVRKDLHYSTNVVVNVRPQFKDGGAEQIGCKGRVRNRQAAKAE